eukprot:gene8834-10447_t
MNTCLAGIDFKKTLETSRRPLLVYRYQKRCPNESRDGCVSHRTHHQRKKGQFVLGMICQVNKFGLVYRYQKRCPNESRDGCVSHRTHHQRKKGQFVLGKVGQVDMYGIVYRSRKGYSRELRKNQKTADKRRASGQGLPKGAMKRQSGNSRSQSVGARARPAVTTTHETKQRSASVGRPITLTKVQLQQQANSTRLSVPSPKKRASLGGSAVPVYDAGKFRSYPKRVLFLAPHNVYYKLMRLRGHLHELATPGTPTPLLANQVMQDWNAVACDGQRDAAAKDGSFKAAQKIEGLLALMDLFYDSKKMTLGVSPDGHQLLPEAIAEARAFAALFDFEEPETDCTASTNPAPAAAAAAAAAVPGVSGEKADTVGYPHGAASTASPVPAPATAAVSGEKVDNATGRLPPNVSAMRSQAVGSIRTPGTTASSSTTGKKAAAGKQTAAAEQVAKPKATNVTAPAAALPVIEAAAGPEALPVQAPAPTLAVSSLPAATTDESAAGAGAILVASNSLVAVQAFINSARQLQKPGAKDAPDLLRNITGVHLCARTLVLLRARNPTSANLPTTEALDAMAEFVHGRAVPVPVLGANGTTVVAHQYLAGPAPDVDEAIEFANKFCFGKEVDASVLASRGAQNAVYCEDRPAAGSGYGKWK